MDGNKEGRVLENVRGEAISSDRLARVLTFTMEHPSGLKGCQDLYPENPIVIFN